MTRGLVVRLGEQQRFYKKAAAFVLRAVAKHSPELAQAVVDCNALDSLVPCLEEFDPSVKEGAAWAIGHIAQHNAGEATLLRPQQNAALAFLVCLCCLAAFCADLADLRNVIRFAEPQSLRSMSSTREPCRCLCCAYRSLKLH
jgi:hypothetical protein